MRKVLIPVAVIALAIAAAAIGGGSERAAAASGSCAKANLNLVKDGQLSIGTDNPAFPPWFAGGETKGRPWKINDPAKGKGFESAVAYAVARRLGFTKNQVVWVYTPSTRRSRRARRATTSTSIRSRTRPNGRRCSRSAPRTTTSTSRSSA